MVQKELALSIIGVLLSPAFVGGQWQRFTTHPAEGIDPLKQRGAL